MIKTETASRVGFLVLLLVLSISVLTSESTPDGVTAFAAAEEIEIVSVGTYYVGSEQISIQDHTEKVKVTIDEEGKRKVVGDFKEIPVNFIMDNQEALQIEASELTLVDSVVHEKDGEDLYYKTYARTHKDIPVKYSHVKVFGKDDTIVSVKSAFQDEIDLSTEPVIKENKAVLIAIEDAEINKNIKPNNVELVIYPKYDSYFLVYQIDFPLTVNPVQSLRYYVDAHIGAIIDKEDTLIYDDLSGTVIGKIYSGMIPNDNESIEMSLEDLEVTYEGSSVYTDENGYYQFNNVATPGKISAVLEGKYVKVINEQTDETVYINNNASGTHNINFTDYDTSDRDVESHMYYHVNFIHDFFTRDAEGEGPFDIHLMDFQMKAYALNTERECNAWYDTVEKSITFVKGTKDCENTGLLADVVYHEYVHAVTMHGLYNNVHFPYSGEPGNMNEGFSDYFPSSIFDEPCLGGGFFKKDGSYGDRACIRNISNTDMYPEDYTDEPHGTVFPGALWDLRKALGKEKADELIFLTMKATPTTFSEFIEDMLLIDDDNPYLSDGTPNMDAICDAFVTKHGINSVHCFGGTGPSPVVSVSWPKKYTYRTHVQYAEEDEVIINGTIFQSMYNMTPFVYRVTYNPFEDNSGKWLIVDHYPNKTVQAGEISRFNLTGVPPGWCDVDVMAYEGGRVDYERNVYEPNMTVSKTFTIDVVTYEPGIRCSTSPCVASSDLLRGKRALSWAGVREPNGPNTIDGCRDGDNYCCHTHLEDPSVENITVIDLNGTNFETGDMIKVSAWVYCHDKGDYTKFSYTNNTKNFEDGPTGVLLDWQIMNGTKCSGVGLEEHSTAFVLDDAEGEHGIRASLQFAGDTPFNRGSCGVWTNDDTDDVIIEVADMSPDVDAPVIEIITPVNNSLVNTSYTIAEIHTDEVTTCSWDLDLCLELKGCENYASGDFGKAGQIHMSKLAELKKVLLENYYLLGVSCTDLDGNSAYVEHKFQVYFPDADGDDVDDTEDMFFCIPEKFKTNIKDINCTVEGIDDYRSKFSGRRKVKVRGKKDVIELPWNFSKARLDLRNLSIQKQSDGVGSLLVSGLDLPENETKKLIVDRLTGNDTMCIKDAEIENISDISSTCDGENEFYMTCNNTLQADKYTCDITADGYVVSGLQYSGLIEFFIDPEELEEPPENETEEEPVPTPAPAAPAPAPSGGGGGGGSVVSNLIRFTNLVPGSDETKEFTARTTPVRSIALSPVELIVSVTLKVNTANAQSIVLPNEIYKFFELETILTEDQLAYARINFEVEKAWLADNLIDRGTVHLYRYTDDAWERLKTSIVKEDDETITYVAVTPGFSVFGISGEEVSERSATDQDILFPEQTEITELTEKLLQEEVHGVTNAELLILVVVAVFLVIIAYREVSRSR